MRWAPFLIAVALLPAQPSAEVLDLFREAAEALANDDAETFLAKFDPGMPGYAMLRDEIVGLLAANQAGSTIDVVNEQGDDRKRSLELDWLLVLTEKNADNGRKETRRGIVKCQIQRQGRVWKITALDPVDFFRY